MDFYAISYHQQVDVSDYQAMLRLDENNIRHGVSKAIIDLFPLESITVVQVLAIL